MPRFPLPIGQREVEGSRGNLWLTHHNKKIICTNDRQLPGFRNYLGWFCCCCCLVFLLLKCLWSSPAPLCSAMLAFHRHVAALRFLEGKQSSLRGGPAVGWGGAESRLTCKQMLTLPPPLISCPHSSSSDTLSECPSPGGRPPPDQAAPFLQNRKAGNTDHLPRGKRIRKTF